MVLCIKINDKLSFKIGQIRKFFLDNRRCATYICRVFTLESEYINFKKDISAFSAFSEGLYAAMTAEPISTINSTRTSGTTGNPNQQQPADSVWGTIYPDW